MEIPKSVGGGMSDPYGVLDRLVDALARGDRDAALNCFAPGATVVVSGSHHDYASYPPATVIDGLHRSFMEISWTPSLRRIVGGARVRGGRPRRDPHRPVPRVRADRRSVCEPPSGSRPPLHRRSSARDAVALGEPRPIIAEALVRPDSDRRQRGHRSRAARRPSAVHAGGGRLPGAAPRGGTDPAAPAPHRPIAPALTMRNRSHRQIAPLGDLGARRCSPSSSASSR